MKYALILLDGMADFKVPALGNKTPVEAARTPLMDKLAKSSEIGLVCTIPDGFKPGSDVANLGVLGYDVRECYTGRSPLEALSMGIELGEKDVAMRANLVTLSDEENFDEKLMLDYSGGEISTEEAAELTNYLSSKLLCDAEILKELPDFKNLRLHAGVSFRECLVIENSDGEDFLTPPHDILDRKIGEYLPRGAHEAVLNKLIKKSYELLKDHPINKKRIAGGKRPANALWFWGAGSKPRLTDFYALYGKRGVMISAVDLLKGIAIAGGLKNAEVEGATGRIDTNFDGKAEAAVKALKDFDFCMIHLEATDECGHQGDAEGKKRAIELIDEKIIAPVYSALSGSGEPFALLIMPDHYTPVTLRTHISDPVPYMLYSSKCRLGSSERFSEETAKASGILIKTPSELTKKFFAL